MPDSHFSTVSLLAIRQVPKHCTSLVQAESSPQNCWLRAFWRWMRPLFSTTFHRPNRHTNFQCFSAHSKRFHSIWDAHRRAPRDLAKGDTKPWVVQKKDWKGMVGQQVQAQHDPAKAQKWQNKKMGEILNNYLKYSCPKGSRELDRKSNRTPIQFRKNCHRLLHVRAFAFAFPLRIFLSNTQILIWRVDSSKGAALNQGRPKKHFGKTIVYPSDYSCRWNIIFDVMYYEISWECTSAGTFSPNLTMRFLTTQ